MSKADNHECLEAEAKVKRLIDQMPKDDDSYPRGFESHTLRESEPSERGGQGAGITLSVHTGVDTTVHTPVLQLHLYKREIKKRVIAEALLERQHGKCNLESDGHVCGYVYWEIDHVNGDPDDWALENLQLLCEKRHRAKTNEDRAKLRRSKGVSVKANAPTADRATWTSKEGQKAEWSRPEFDKWIASPQTWIDLGRKVGMDLTIGEPAYLADLLDFGADSINDPDYPEGVSQETLRRYVKARRFSTLKLDKLGHRVTVRFVGMKSESLRVPAGQEGA